jgi:hypothetical protein
MRRLLILLPLWLAFAIADPGVLHSCPMHGGMPAATSLSHAAGHAHHHAPQAPEHHHGACTCIGACTAATAIFAPTAATTIALGTIVDTHVATPAFESRVSARDAQYRLPFSNGPPSSPVAA